MVRRGAQGRSRRRDTLLSPPRPALPLAVAGLVHTYQPGQPPVVRVDRLELPAGAIAALTGPSGSGKTTLAHLLAGIERLQRGAVRWGETELALLSEAERDAWRLRHLGFVFQEFHLVPGLSILGNVLISGWFDALRPPPALRARAEALLDRLAVPWVGRGIDALSRGEQQRVAIARAFLRDPLIVIADEPTASLDACSGAAAIELLLDLARMSGATLLAVTHDPALIQAAGYRLRLDHGRLVAA